MKTKIIIGKDKIDNYQDIARVFFKNMFDMNLDKVLITDISDLSDFSGSGMSPEQYDQAEGRVNLDGLPKNKHLQEVFNEIGKYWDKLVFEKIKDQYGIELKSTVIKLIDLFETISRNQYKPKVLH